METAKDLNDLREEIRALIKDLQYLEQKLDSESAMELLKSSKSTFSQFSSDIKLTSRKFRDLERDLEDESKKEEKKIRSIFDNLHKKYKQYQYRDDGEIYKKRHYYINPFVKEHVALLAFKKDGKAIIVHSSKIDKLFLNDLVESCKKEGVNIAEISSHN